MRLPVWILPPQWLPVHRLRLLAVFFSILAVAGPVGAGVEMTGITEPKRIDWQATGVEATIFEIQVETGLTASAVWRAAGMELPTGAVVSARLNVTNAMAFYRVVAVTSAFPATRHAMALIPDVAYAMGNPFSHLVEGWPRESPVHSVPVGSFLMDRFEVSYEPLLEVYNWALDKGLAQVVSFVYTNVSGGTTNVLTNVNDRVVNTEGMAMPLLSVNRSSSDVGYTNGTLYLYDAERARFPALNVSWFGAQAYCNFRSDMEGLPRAIDFGPTNWAMVITNDGYRLPTEAEWEKASRGDVVGGHFPWPNDSLQGTNVYTWSIDPVRANYLDARYLQDGLAHHPAHPWFNKMYLDTPPYGTTPVGYYNGSQVVEFSPGATNPWVNFNRGADWGVTQDMANAYGLYDMAGNVYEWCYDWAGTNWYGKLEASWPDPMGEGIENRNELALDPARGPPARIIRGGGWRALLLMSNQFDPSYLRCAYREMQDPLLMHPALGFRTVRSLP